MDIQQRIREIMAKEAEAITRVEVTPAFEKAVHALRACTGKVLTTGMGKAGNVVACGETREAMEQAFTEARNTVHFELE